MLAKDASNRSCFVLSKGRECDSVQDSEAMPRRIDFTWRLGAVFLARCIQICRFW